MTHYTNLNNVTPIEFLPNLEDIDSSYNTNTSRNYSGVTMVPSDEVKRVSRNIRDSHVTPSQAGMNHYNNHNMPVTMSNDMVNYGNHNYENPNYGVMIDQQEKPFTTFNMPKDSPSCLSFAEHHANCPICSRFYNNDKTIYIIAIVVLSIVCILLLNRLLNM